MSASQRAGMAANRRKSNLHATTAKLFCWLWACAAPNPTLEPDMPLPVGSGRKDKRKIEIKTVLWQKKRISMSRFLSLMNWVPSFPHKIHGSQLLPSLILYAQLSRFFSLCDISQSYTLIWKDTAAGVCIVPCRRISSKRRFLKSSICQEVEQEVDRLCHLG